MKDVNHPYKDALFFPKQSKEPLLNVPFIIVVLIALCFCIYIVPKYFFSEQLYIEIIKIFSFIPVLFKSDPLAFCYTLISYSFMHGSLKHVSINMVWLLVFGSPLVRHLGSLRFLIFWVLTAIVAALAYFVLHQDSAVSLVGASGAVSGMMGGIVRYGFPHSCFGVSMQNERLLGSLLSIKSALCSKVVLAYVSIWLSVDFIVAFFPFLFEEDGVLVAWEAHIGGFFSGFLLISFFDISCKKLKTTI
ncbi:rhomboid family intramembrane serine protease [Bartonella sp. CB169]|uniref:rhomboid family intramembrane serine protease n=1 Tax=Bartonella sp. CB169 TaxID=3112257 RepID=UPI00300DF20E